jgi:dTDP-4-dehydrorhamnose 3,5-epimerase
MPSDPLSLESLGPDFRPVLTTQQYGPSEKIDGVKIIDLRLLTDDGGSFVELVRLTEQGTLEAIPDFHVRQSSYSLVLPGAVKAFHLHFSQDDVWFVPPTDRLLIGLVDARSQSPSHKVSMRFVMGAGKAQLLFIPRGVGHGCANTGVAPASIVYFVNQQFRLKEPDERRLPWDHLGANFWQMTPG